MLRNVIQNKFLKNISYRSYYKAIIRNEENKYLEVQFTSLNNSLHEIYLRNRNKCPSSIFKHYKNIVVENNIDYKTSISHGKSLSVIDESDIHSISTQNKINNDNNLNIKTPLIKEKKERNQCTLSMRKEFLSNTNKCLDCFMLKPLCICHKVKKLYKKPIRTNFQFELYCHIKEYGRASNTGNLLSIIVPNQTNVTLFDSGVSTRIKQEEILYNCYGDNIISNNNEINSFSNITSNRIEDVLENRIKSLSSNNDNNNNNNNKPMVLVLYPGPKSIPISTYKHLFQDNSQQLILCIIDSTWTQSKSMEKSIPSEYIRVNIDETAIFPSQFLSRKQSDIKTRVSTIESLALAISTLGEDKEVVDQMFSILQLRVDALKKQSGKKSVYGNKFIPIITDDGFVGPFTQSQVTKPDHCPSCNQSIIDTNFKNLGIRPLNKEHQLRRQWKCSNCKTIFCINI